MKINSIKNLLYKSLVVMICMPLIYNVEAANNIHCIDGFDSCNDMQKQHSNTQANWSSKIINIKLLDNLSNRYFANNNTTYNNIRELYQNIGNCNIDKLINILKKKTLDPILKSKNSIKTNDSDNLMGDKADFKLNTRKNTTENSQNVKNNSNYMRYKNSKAISNNIVPVVRNQATNIISDEKKLTFFQDFAQTKLDIKISNLHKLKQSFNENAKSRNILESNTIDNSKNVTNNSNHLIYKKNKVLSSNNLKSNTIDNSKNITNNSNYLIYKKNKVLSSNNSKLNTIDNSKNVTNNIDHLRLNEINKLKPKTYKRRKNKYNDRDILQRKNKNDNKQQNITNIESTNKDKMTPQNVTNNIKLIKLQTQQNNNNETNKMKKQSSKSYNRSDRCNVIAKSDIYTKPIANNKSKLNIQILEDNNVQTINNNTREIKQNIYTGKQTKEDITTKNFLNTDTRKYDKPINYFKNTNFDNIINPNTMNKKYNNKDSRIQRCNNGTKRKKLNNLKVPDTDIRFKLNNFKNSNNINIMGKNIIKTDSRTDKQNHLGKTRNNTNTKSIYLKKLIINDLSNLSISTIKNNESFNCYNKTKKNNIENETAIISKFVTEDIPQIQLAGKNYNNNIISRIIKNELKKQIINILLANQD